jgi:hypothetical protein
VFSYRCAKSSFEFRARIVKFKENRNRFCQARNRFLGSIKGLEIRGQNAKPPFYVRVIQRICAVLHSSVYEYMLHANTNNFYTGITLFLYGIGIIT